MPRSLHGSTIVVAEDDRITRELLSGMLREHGFLVEAVADGQAAVERVAKGKSYVVVDSYRTPEQKALFEDWVLTAEFHDYPEEWIRVFGEAGYTGDWDWTIVE